MEIEVLLFILLWLWFVVIVLSVFVYYEMKRTERMLKKLERLAQKLRDRHG